MFERSYQRSVRVMAPRRALYQEMDSARAVVRFIPRIQAHPSVLEGEQVYGDADRCQGSITIAALPYRLATSITVEPIDPPHALRIRLRVPRLRLDITGMVTLSSCARTETTVHYSARLSTTHPLLRRLRTCLVDVLEDHVAATTELIALRARQYTRAEHHLADTHPSRHR